MPNISKEQIKLTQNDLKSLLKFDSETGVFTWLKSKNNRVKVGSVAGNIHPSGYCRIMINKKHYLTHNLVWLYKYGELTDKFIDHIDGDKANNRVENLRTCTRSQNMYNIGIRSDSTSGYKGVYRNAALNKWQARAKISGKQTNLGYFSTPEEASEAYQTFAKANHGEFYRI